MKLMLRLILGIAVGLLVGHYARVLPGWVMSLLVAFQDYFGQFIKFMIPLIIFFMVTSGIASLRAGAGRVLGATLGMAYMSTIVAGFLAYFLALNILPSILPEQVSMLSGGGEHGGGGESVIKPLFEVPTALALALIFGVGVSATNHHSSRMLYGCFQDGSKVIDFILAKVLIPFLPIYIGGIFAHLAQSGEAFTILKNFVYVLGLAIGVHVLWLIVLYALGGFIARRNPIMLLRSMLPAYTTAVGTMSSAATIPVTLRSVRNMGVSESSARFTVPLCANVHLSGSMITVVTCTLAVMWIAPDLHSASLSEVVRFILVLGVVMVAAPGAPGGAVMAALGILSSMLGFNETHLAMMIALYSAQDSFGTACNVTGDGLIALVVDRLFGRDQHDEIIEETCVDSSALEV